MENQDFVTAPQKYGTANGGYATRNEYDFVENKDYTLLNKKMEQVSGAKHLVEYYISLDMAKQLAMAGLLIVTGLRTVSQSTILLKIKTLLSSTKKWSFQRAGGQRG